MTNLREALAARPDDDFVTSAPQRRAAPARRPASGTARRTAPAKAKKPSIGTYLLSFVLHHPKEVFAATLLTGCAGAIAWNALALQTVRHPAPLFNHAAHPAELAPQAVPSVLPPMRPATGTDAQQPEQPLPAHAQPPATAAPPPPSAARPPARSPIGDLINRNEITQPQRVSAAPPPLSLAPPAPPPARATTERDPIADMIRMGGPVPVPPANVGDPVLSGQRALAKLGYSVKPDGIMGNETRQAIERFERDRHLPATGEFSSRTMRELSALSGIPVP